MSTEEENNQIIQQRLAQARKIAPSINIELDTRRTEEMAKENERLRMTNEDLNEKLRLSAEAHIKKKMAEYGLPLDRLPEFMANPEALKSYEPRQTPSGSAPLNAQQYGQSDDIYRRRFPDQKSMVDAILSDMHGSDLQKAEVARSYYNKMLELWVRSKRETQKYDENFFNPNLPQNMPSDLKRTPEGFLVSENEGDIKRITNSWRAERLRKMGKINDKGEVIQ